MVRESIPFERRVLLYFVRCLARIEGQESLPELLFTDFALMTRLGFNAHDLKFGITARGRTARPGPRRNLRFVSPSRTPTRSSSFSATSTEFSTLPSTRSCSAAPSSTPTPAPPILSTSCSRDWRPRGDEAQARALAGRRTPPSLDGHVPPGVIRSEQQDPGRWLAGCRPLRARVPLSPCNYSYG